MVVGVLFLQRRQLVQGPGPYPCSLAGSVICRLSVVVQGSSQDAGLPALASPVPAASLPLWPGASRLAWHHPFIQITSIISAWYLEGERHRHLCPLQWIFAYPCWFQFVLASRLHIHFPSGFPYLRVFSHLLVVMLLCSNLIETGRSKLGPHFLLQSYPGCTSISTFISVLHFLVCHSHCIEVNVRQGFDLSIFYCNELVLCVMH